MGRRAAAPSQRPLDGHHGELHDADRVVGRLGRQPSALQVEEDERLDLGWHGGGGHPAGHSSAGTPTGRADKTHAAMLILLKSHKTRISISQKTSSFNTALN